MANLKFIQPADFDAAAPAWAAFFQAPGNYREVSYSSTQWTLAGTAASGLAGYQVTFTGAFTRAPSGGVPSGNITGFAVYDAAGAELYEGNYYSQPAIAVVTRPTILFEQPYAGSRTEFVLVTLTSGNDRFVVGPGDFRFSDTAGSDTLIRQDGSASISFASNPAAVVIDLSSTPTQVAGLGSLTLSDFHSVVGSRFADRITGSSADDYIAGNGGSDIIDAGAGNDTISLSNARGPYGDLDLTNVVMAISGGEGNDTIDDDTLYVTGSVVRGGGGDDIINFTSRNFGNVVGASYYGDDGDDLLSGKRSYLENSGSGNMLDGGAGNDTFRNWAAGNTLLGGSGDDKFELTNEHPNSVGYSTIDGGSGYDTLLVRGIAAPAARFLSIYLGGNEPSGPGVVAATNIEELRYSVEPENSSYRAGQLSPLYIYGGGEDDIVIGGGSVGVTIDGGGGNDRLNGTGGADFISAGSGNDRLGGGEGNDELRPGGGIDLVDGSTGTDTLILAGTYASYRTVAVGGRNYLVGPGQQVQVYGIEAVRFDDVSVTFDSLSAQAMAFDGLRYIASSPDLVAAYGADAQAGLTHFVEHGSDEGRSFASFDPLRYLASYGDLIAAYGGDTQAATEHYILHGAAEGRSAALFDPYRYLASYTDLVAAYGADAQAAEQHYVAYGYAEGRNPLLFDTLMYAATNTDLAVAYGADAAALARHYVEHGFAEHRLTTGFDAVGYLLTYADLGAAGYGAAGALQHWVEHGAGEGRIGDALFGREQTNHALASSTGDALETAGDHDWFQLELIAGEHVEIDFTSLAIDGIIGLYDAAGKLVAFDDGSAAGHAAGIDYDAAAAGSYYLAVSDRTGTELGDYALALAQSGGAG